MFNVVANDRDIDDAMDTMRVVITSDPAHGGLSCTAGGQLASGLEQGSRLVQVAGCS